MHIAKQSTAANLIVGPILDSTGAEYASAVIGDLSIAKHDATTLTALASAATLTYLANGMYSLVTTTGNTDTLGRARISCNKSTYQMPPVYLMILPATVYDAIVTNATNATGGLLAATAAVSAVAGYVGASGAAINGTNANTLSSHDPGATLGTSTLTQAQVTGGAYALNHASFAFASALDFTTTQKSATLARVTLVDTTTTNTDMRGTDSAALAATALSTATWTATRAGYLDNLSGGAVMLASSYSAPPSAATISAQVASDLAAAHGSGSWATATGFSTLDAAGVRSAVGLATANLDTQLVDLPTVAEFEARTLVSASYGTAANQAIIAAYLDTEVAAILAAVDTEVGAIKAKTDQLTFTVANQVDANTLTIVGTADDAVLSAIAALNNLSAAQVNAECDSALSDAGVTTARMAALADWIDGGRLDLLLDAILDDTGTAGVALSAAICNKIADHVRRSTQANVEASSDGDTLSKSSQYGAIQQIQKSNTTDTAGLLTIKKTDGTTLGTLTLTSDAAGEPLTGVS